MIRTAAATGIRTVCFDLGGVLVRICHSWAEACRSAGMPFRMPDIMASQELVNRRRLTIDALQRGEIEESEYYAALSGATGELYSPSEVHQIHHAWLLGEYPGVGELISTLSRVVHTACLSNTNEMHWRRLVGDDVAYPSLRKLQSKLASHELRALKPDPKIFALAQETLNTPAAGILFFDDLDPNVQAAREHGWHAERIDPHADTVPQLVGYLERYGVL